VNDIASLAGPVATMQSGSLAAFSSSAVVPVLIASIGEQASWRYVEFFAANIRNPNTRRACSRFFAWCEDRGLTLAGIRPFDVAAYIEQLGREMGAPSRHYSSARSGVLLGQMFLAR